MADEITQIHFSDEEYQKAAKDWSKPLMMLPLLQVADILKYMTGWGGVRYEVALPTVEGNAQFAPYNAFRKSTSDLQVDFRTLKSHKGNVVFDFEPDAYLHLLIGKAAGILGDAQKEAPSAKLVLACAMKSLGYHLRQSLMKAKRNPEGNTTMDLFDGWMTIIDQEIEGGAISAANGNLLKLTEAITSANAVDAGKEIERSCDPYLRSSKKFLYCAPEFADAYNDAYLLTHAGINYNKQYEQSYLEGSGQNTTIVPLDVLSGSNKMILTPSSNMLYGYDNMSQASKLQVDRFSPFLLTMSGIMFFGTQIYTLDKRFFKVIELAD